MDIGLFVKCFLIRLSYEIRLRVTESARFVHFSYIAKQQASSTEAGIAAVGLLVLPAVPKLAPDLQLFPSK